LPFGEGDGGGLVDAVRERGEGGRELGGDCLDLGFGADSGEEREGGGGGEEVAAGGHGIQFTRYNEKRKVNA
jgi:hypothetical protein